MGHQGRHYSESSSESRSRSRSRGRRRSHSKRVSRHSSHSHRNKHSHDLVDQYGRDIHVLSDSSNEEKSSRDNSKPYRKVSKQYAESDSPGLGIEDGMDGFAIDMDDYAYQTNQNTSHDRNSKLQSTKTPEINSIHKAIIKRVLNFGSFARIHGYPFDGLIYSSNYIPDLPAPREGQEVWVKVQRVFESDGKIKMSLTLKECNQRTGQDLNPSNEHDEGYFADTQVIQSGSVRKTVCSRCGLVGHADWECYTDLSKKELYTLVSDDEEKPKEEHRLHRHRHRHKHYHK